MTTTADTRAGPEPEPVDRWAIIAVAGQAYAPWVVLNVRRMAERESIRAENERHRREDLGLGGPIAVDTGTGAGLRAT